MKIKLSLFKFPPIVVSKLSSKALLIISNEMLYKCSEFTSEMPNDDPTPDELFNSPEMKQLRSDLLAGIKNPTCDACWKREARGQRSFRITTPYQPEAELNTLDLAASMVLIRLAFCALS